MYSSIQAEHEAGVCAIKNEEAASEEDFARGGYSDLSTRHGRVMASEQLTVILKEYEGEERSFDRSWWWSGIDQSIQGGK